MVSCLVRQSSFINDIVPFSVSLYLCRIESTQVSIKQCGVLPPVAKFPSFVERVESVVRGVRSQVGHMDKSIAFLHFASNPLHVEE